MKSLILAKADLTAEVEKYILDATTILERSFTFHQKSEEFRELYRTCLAVSGVLSEMNSARLKPGIKPLRSIALRIPLLAAAGQSSTIKVELRQFIELTLWTIYFTDHPVEWQNFVGRRGIGFSRDTRKPISFAAHRELTAYTDYALEYMEVEPSGVAVRAIKKIEQDKRELNSAVHAGHIARSPLLNVPVDRFDPREGKRLTGLVKRIFGHSVILLAAFDKRKFDRLPAGARAYFDWLIEPSFQKQIRSGPFGVGDIS